MLFLQGSDVAVDTKNPSKKLHTSSSSYEVLQHAEISNQTPAPHINWSELHASEHIVQFYETDNFLLDAVSDFVSTGLNTGAACLVIATKSHRQELEERLRATGLDLSSAQARRKYIALDAAKTLSRFLVDEAPEPQRFVQVVKSLLKRAVKERRPVHIFGEMVALLWMQGNQAAAIQLEALWNDIRTHTSPFVLFCAYPMQSFAQEEYAEPLLEICRQHSHVIPDESYTNLASQQERLRAITLLQQRASSLTNEIAERKRTENHLLIAENRYRHLFEISTNGIFSVDPITYTIIDANPFMTELLGYTHEQLLHQPLEHCSLFADKETTLKILQGLQEHPFVWYEVVPLLTKNGQLRYVEFLGTRIQANGQQTIQCHLRDITAYKRMEAALHHSEERFHTLANQTPIIIWQANTIGSTIYVNTAWCIFTGLSEVQSLGIGWTRPIHPDDRDATFTLWMQALITHVPYRHQFRLHRADGIYRHVQIFANPWTNRGSLFAGYIGTILDITEQKELEIQRKAFVHLVTHEFTISLTTMQSEIQLAQHRLTELLSQTKPSRAHLQQIHEEVLTLLNHSQHLLQAQQRLINNLLNRSPIEEDGGELHPTHHPPEQEDISLNR